MSNNWYKTNTMFSMSSAPVCLTVSLFSNCIHFFFTYLRIAINKREKICKKLICVLSTVSEKCVHRFKHTCKSTIFPKTCLLWEITDCFLHTSTAAVRIPMRPFTSSLILFYFLKYDFFSCLLSSSRCPLPYAVPWIPSRLVLLPPLPFFNPSCILLSPHPVLTSLRPLLPFHPVFSQPSLAYQSQDNGR